MGWDIYWEFSYDTLERLGHTNYHDHFCICTLISPDNSMYSQIMTKIYDYINLAPSQLQLAQHDLSTVLPSATCNNNPSKSTWAPSLPLPWKPVHLETLPQCLSHSTVHSHCWHKVFLPNHSLPLLNHLSHSSKCHSMTLLNVVDGT